MDSRYLTTAEVAAALRVSTDTVLRLIDRGSLPAVRVSERIYRIPAPAFAQFEKGRVARRRVVVRKVEDYEEFGSGEGITDDVEAQLTTS